MAALATIIARLWWDRLGIARCTNVWSTRNFKVNFLARQREKRCDSKNIHSLVIPMHKTQHQFWQLIRNVLLAINHQSSNVKSVSITALFCVSMAMNFQFSTKHAEVENCKQLYVAITKTLLTVFYQEKTNLSNSLFKVFLKIISILLMQVSGKNIYLHSCTLQK